MKKENGTFEKMGIYNRTKHAFTHKCQWCEDRLPYNECEFEASFGWLCENCISYLQSTGETLIIIR